VIAGVNVITADTKEKAEEQFLAAKRNRVTLLLGRDRQYTDEEADMILESPAGQQILQMTKYSAIGTPDEVTAYLDWFAEHARADELIVVSAAPDRQAWLRSFELLAEARGLVPA
jgi:alkanesulfonate monooxygenase SsuD/methylene tetrahydromethanopterin reductase-like flavin-dependent oxidoreductase (luciferase family)